MGGGELATIAGMEKAEDNSRTSDRIRSARELLDEWRLAERMGNTARSAAEVAALAVEAADAAKAAAGEAQVSVDTAADAVNRAKEASDLAASAAHRAATAADLIYAEAQEDKERTAELLDGAETAEAEAADAYHEAQRQKFADNRD
jgi:hypothetical protein